MTEPVSEKRAERAEKAQASNPVPVRCKQTGFTATIPAKDWNGYTDDQRDAYEIVKGDGDADGSK
ncbi:hypothetical protein ACSMXM_05495 [Pacificimonas sp. ICDLI1SI03]